MDINHFDRTDFINAVELQHYTGLSLSSIYRKIHSDGFPRGIIVNKKAYFSKEDITEQMKKQFNKGTNNEK